MSDTFHQILSQLRKNKGVSQRKVASDLYISQALLSHYENGIREPGLDFVNRACSYYGVTADFLLGRTEADLVESLVALHTEGKEVQLDAQALLALLYALGQYENDGLRAGALRCFGAVAYRLLRHMAAQKSDRPPPGLTVPENRVAALSDLELRLGELQFLDGLEGLFDPRAPDESNPVLPQQLEALLTSLDNQLSSHIRGKE